MGRHRPSLNTRGSWDFEWMTGSLQLREYPGEIVRLSCAKCGRAGEGGRRGLMQDACMVLYVDLVPEGKGAAAMVKNGGPRYGYNTTLGSGALEPLAHR